MEGEYGDVPKKSLSKRVRRFFRICWLVIEHFFDLAADAFAEYWLIIKREIELFLGIALSLGLLLDFQNGKNCDGNTADYLSCTRPSTFYYYAWWQILLIVIGVFLLILWYVRERRAK